MQHSIHQLSSSKCFGATVERYSHISPTLGNTSAKFHVIMPPQIKKKYPCYIFLAGLTCNDETFVLYSGAQRYAAFYGILVVCPDTSPRDTGEDREYNFGSSAGVSNISVRNSKSYVTIRFYVNATTQPWNKYYHMFDYVTKELPEVICSNFNVDNTRQSIFWSFYGGHGALICALKNPTQYLSVSAFAPVSNPLNCSFGRKCLRGYLGNDKESWKQYDATELIKEKGPQFSDIFIDQGTLDPF
ncbi:S-formylglutathione hydrolase [Galdieria sulphuraria]|nr:S-formylglutathione hydrolase [Galdieria sulphuraria]